MTKLWEKFANKAEKFNIKLSTEQIEQFKEYWKFLYDYNSHTNIVSSAEEETVVYKHFIDSLSFGLLNKDINLNSDKKIIDIGAGGGFPGVPIIIAFPQLKLCAVDSVRKKTDFLSELSKTLGLENRIEVINSRAEELARLDDKRAKFDISVSRAVSKLNVIMEYNMPFVKKGGYFVAYKAKTVKEEIMASQKALPSLGGNLLKTVNYTLLDEERNLVLIKKTAQTSEKYPRKTGIPLKQPL